MDVGSVGPDFQALDMVAPTKGWEAAYTWSDKIGPEAKANRQMLTSALLGAGFSNCRDEWWHWSYGDNAWAVRTGSAWAPFGHMPPPPGHTFVARRRRRAVGYHLYGPARLRRRAWG